MSVSGTFVELIVAGTAAETDFSTLDTTGYDALIVYAEGEGFSGRPSVSDSEGNEWLGLDLTERTTPAILFSRLFYTNLASRSATHVVTVTMSATTPEFQRLALWGVVSSTGKIALRQQSNATLQNSSGDIDAGSLTTTEPAFLVMGANLNAPATHAAGAGWTARATTNIILQDRTEAAGGTFDPVSTHDALADYTAVSAAFRAVPPLSDTNLVVRYYFDEAASGTAPTQIDDASGNAYHLTEVNYGSGNLAWTEVGGNRGLESLSTTGAQRARRAIDNASDVLRDALAGSQKSTFEIVLTVSAFNTNNSRFCVINNRVGGNPIFGLAGPNETAVSGFWGASSVTTGFPFDEKVVVHVVVDTTIPDPPGSGRLKMYHNGVLVASGDSGTSQYDTLSLPSDIDLICFNRENSGGWDRSAECVIGYVAIYDDAFDSARVLEHYAALSAGDDAPPSVATIPVPAPAHKYLHLLVR